MQETALFANAGDRRDLPLSGMPRKSAGGGSVARAGFAHGVMIDRLSPVAAGLRRHDRDRYQTALFAPADRRDGLFALYAFNHEIARVRESVREPFMGLMRLQWWRDAVGEIYAGAPPRRHEIVAPLAAAIAAHRLSQAHFTALLDARARDMEETPLESLAALETYAADTSSRLLLLALEILGVDNGEAHRAAGAIGTAYALAGLLVAAPFHARLRRLYLPQELIARHGVDLERSLFSWKTSPALAAAAREIATRARGQLGEARRHCRGLPRAALPVLLHGVLAERRLQRLESVAYNLMEPRLATEDTLQSARLAWAALRRRF